MGSKKNAAVIGKNKQSTQVSMKVIICGTICHNNFPHSVATKCYNAIKVNKQEIVKGNSAMKLASKDSEAL